MGLERLTEYGIMELWNTGRLVFKRILSIFNFIVSTNFAINQHCIIPEPIIPIFQYSSIPFGA
jgi:hypothetical protein